MLAHSLRLYVPSTGGPASARPERTLQLRVERTEALLLRSGLGGTTTTQGIGSYRDAHGDIIRESVAIVEAFSDDPCDALAKAWASIMLTWNQESVLYECDGRRVLYSGK